MKGYFFFSEMEWLRSYSLIIILLLNGSISTAIYGQNETTDSLIQVLANTDDVLEQAILNTTIGKEYYYSDIKKSIVFSQKAVDLLNENDAVEKEKLPSFLLNLAFAHYTADDVKNFKETLDKARPLIENEKDRSSIYNLLGKFYEYTNLDSSQHYFRLNLQMRIALENDNFVPSGFNQLGMAYAMQGDLPEADSLWQVGLNWCNGPEYYSDKNSLLYNLCVLNSQNGDFDQMLVYAKEGYNLSLTSEDPNAQMNFLNVLTNISLFQGDSLQAIEHRLEAYDLIKENGFDDNPAADVLYDLANYYIGLDSNILGRKFAVELMDISKPQNYINGVAKANALLALVASKDGIKDQSLVYIKAALSDTAKMLGDQHENTVLMNCIDMLHAYDQNSTALELTYRVEKNLKNNYHILIEQSLWKFRYQIFKALNDAENALLAHEKFKNVSDKIASTMANEDLITAKVEFEAERQKLNLEKKEIEVAALTQQSESRLRLMMLGGFGLLMLFGLIVLFRSRKFAKTKSDMMKTFSQNLINSQEDERKRLARELHDGVGQRLMIVTKKTTDRKDPELHQMTSNTLDEIRRISRGLHPPNLTSLGVTQAIRSMIDEMDSSTKEFFTHDLDNIDTVVDEQTALHIYRIIQEAITNAIKHAKAKAVGVYIALKSESIELKIQDNGVGFDVSAALAKTSSLGMKTLNERCNIIGADLQIESKLNNGSEIVVDIPI